jgi:hypothetical protein
VIHVPLGKLQTERLVLVDSFVCQIVHRLRLLGSLAPHVRGKRPKYYSKPLPAAPMALEKSVHSLTLPQVSRAVCDPIYSQRGFLSR